MTPEQEIYAGFTEAGSNISTRTHRAWALLRLMQYRFKNGGRLADSEEHDMEVLVDVCLETMPRHDDDINDPLDVLDTQVRRAMKAEAKRTECLANILNSMQIVARNDATCEELTAAAGKVFEIAKAHDAYEPDWRTLKKTVEARGLKVSILTIGGLCLGPSVRTKAMRKAGEKADRIVKNQESGESHQPGNSLIKASAWQGSNCINERR